MFWFYLEMMSVRFKSSKLFLIILLCWEYLFLLSPLPVAHSSLKKLWPDYLSVKCDIPNFLVTSFVCFIYQIKTSVFMSSAIEVCWTISWILTAFEEQLFPYLYLQSNLYDISLVIDTSTIEISPPRLELAESLQENIQWVLLTQNVLHYSNTLG